MAELLSQGLTGSEAALFSWPLTQLPCESGSVSPRLSCKQETLTPTFRRSILTRDNKIYHTRMLKQNHHIGELSRVTIDTKQLFNK